MGTKSKIEFAKSLLVTRRQELIENGLPDCEWTFEEFNETGQERKFIANFFGFKLYEK